MKRQRKGIIAGALVLGCFLLALFTACPEEQKPNKKPDPTYSITLDSAFVTGKGTVSFVPRGGISASKVPAGTIVDLYCNPAQGTENTVGDIIFSGDPIALTQKDGAYSFMMPARNITINVIFQREPGSNEFTITKGPVYQERGNFRISPMDPQAAGALVTLDVTCRTGYKVHSVSIVSQSAAAVTVNKVTENVKYTFAMPSSNVVVYVIFTLSSGTETTYKVSKGTVKPDEGDFNIVNAAGEEITAADGLLEGMPVFIVTEPVETFGVTAVTVSGTPSVIVNEIEKDLVYSFLMPGRNVTVDVSFQGPPSHDLAAAAFAINAENAKANAGANTGTALANAFNGEWGNNFQVQGGASIKHWLAIDLGEVTPIRTVRVVWGLSSGATGNYNGMVGYDIQVSTADTWPTEDTQWTNVLTVLNPGNDGTNVRNDQERVNHKEFSQSYPARFVRIIQNDLLNDSGAASATRPWTNWPSWAMFQVYSIANVPEIIAPIANKSIGYEGTGGTNDTVETGGLRVVRPVWGGTAAALDTNYAPSTATGNKYTAKLVSINPPIAATGVLSGKYAPKTAYTFTFELEAKDTKDWFNETVVNVYLKNDTIPYTHASVATTLAGDFNEKKFSVSYTFPMTESDEISKVEFVEEVKQAVNDESITVLTNYAPENALYTASLVIEESTGSTASSGWSAFTVGDQFKSNKFYRYTFTVNASTVKAYWFPNDVEVPEIDMIEAAQITGKETNELTIAYIFDANADRWVSHGCITVTAPVPGVAALATGTATEYSDDTEIFTARLTKIDGTFNAGAYVLGNVYKFEFTLTPSAGYKFGDFDHVAITINENHAEYEWVNETTAKVTYSFPELLFPIDPRARNYALGITNPATGDPRIVAAPGGLNTGAVIYGPFDGNVATTGATYWQSTDGASNRTWFAVDLGEQRDIGTIRIRWMGTGDGWNGMINYDIQIPEASATLPPVNTSYSDEGWTSVAAIRRDRGVRGAIDYDTIILPVGTKSKWVRIQRAEGSHTTAATEHTNWHGIITLEVYKAGYTEATPFSVGSITIPADFLPKAAEEPPTPGVVLATGTNSTMEFVRLVNPEDLADGQHDRISAGEFDYMKVYIYEVKITAANGYRFTAARPTINGTPITVVESNDGIDMIVKYSCPVTEPDPNVDGEDITITGGTLTANGLTATLTTNFNNAPVNADIIATITVTGTATKGTIFVSGVTSSNVTLVFEPGVGGAASPIAARNIGKEAIGSATQPEGHWKFHYTFKMPANAVSISLDSLFKTDLAPDRPNAGTTTAISSRPPTGNPGRNASMAFNGEYVLDTAGTENRWEATGGNPLSARGAWIAVNLGAEYNVQDIILRQRNNAGTPRIFQVYVANAADGATEWTALSGKSGDPRLAEQDANDLIKNNTNWKKLWDVTTTTTSNVGNASYIPLFVSEAGKPYSFITLGTGAANGIGPYPAATPLTGHTGTSVVFTPQQGQYVLLYVDVQNNEGANNLPPSFINFEVYGTPVTP